MKARFVCFKLSFKISVLILVVIMEIGFILYQIKELREVRKF